MASEEESQEKIIIRGVLLGGKVFVSSPESVEWLRERGYGDGDKQIVLMPYEALFLSSIARLVVTDRHGKEISFDGLFDHLKKKERNLWLQFLITRDLRTRGYVVKDGFGLGIDFNIYDRGDYPEKPSQFLVVGLSEGSPMKAGALTELLRRAQANRKALIMAVIDRRSEVVYYEISRLH